MPCLYYSGLKLRQKQHQMLHLIQSIFINLYIYYKFYLAIN